MKLVDSLRSDITKKIDIDVENVTDKNVAHETKNSIKERNSDSFLGDRTKI